MSSFTTEMSSSDITVSTILQFHTITTDTPPITFSEEAYHFGKLDLSISSAEPIPYTWDVKFSVDNSGSMSDICQDGRSKMQHIKHTLSNIIRLFASYKKQTFNVSISTFNHNLQEIIGFTTVTDETVDSIISKINQIYDDGSTNLVKPLIETNQQMELRRTEFPDNKQLHFLLTDGIDSCGNDAKKIIEAVVSDYETVVFGFGIDHDTKTLTKIGELPNCSYGFIAEIERAGIVYGEFIYNIIYRTVTDVTIEMQNAELYCWKTNSWNTVLPIGSLPSNVNKTYYVRTTQPINHIVGIVYGRTCSLNTTRDYGELDTIYTLPLLLNDWSYGLKTHTDQHDAICMESDALGHHDTQLDINDWSYGLKIHMDQHDARCMERDASVHHTTQLDINGNNQYVDIDLFDHIYRYKTLELLYKANTAEFYSQPVPPYMSYCHTNMNTDNSKIHEIKKQLLDLYINMRNYMKAKYPDGSSFMEGLLDDIYICRVSFDNNYMRIYSTTRQRSQGNQNVYTPTSLSISSQTEPQTPRAPSLFPPFTKKNAYPLNRTHTHMNTTQCLDSQDPYLNLNLDDDVPCSPLQLPLDMLNNIDIDDVRNYNTYALGEDELNNEIIFNNHTISQNTQEVYSNPTMQEVIRSTSETVDEE